MNASTFTFPAEHHHILAGTKLYWRVTEGCVCTVNNSPRVISWQRSRANCQESNPPPLDCDSDVLTCPVSCWDVMIAFLLILWKMRQ